MKYIQYLYIAQIDLFVLGYLRFLFVYMVFLNSFSFFKFISLFVILYIIKIKRMINFIFKSDSSDFICCNINGKRELYDIQSEKIINSTHPHKKSIITEINQTIITYSNEILGRFKMDKIKIVVFDFGCTIAQSSISKYTDKFED